MHLTETVVCMFAVEIIYFLLSQKFIFSVVSICLVLVVI